MSKTLIVYALAYDVFENLVNYDKSVVIEI